MVVTIDPSVETPDTIFNTAIYIGRTFSTI